MFNTTIINNKLKINFFFKNFELSISLEKKSKKNKKRDKIIINYKNKVDIKNDENLFRKEVISLGFNPIDNKFRIN